MFNLIRLTSFLLLAFAVPPQTVGCLIGAKGATIKEMNRASGATIKIEKVKDGSGRNPEDEARADHRVTIVGPGDCHTRAQWLIFERLRSSGLIQSAGELKFTVEMTVSQNSRKLR